MKIGELIRNLRVDAKAIGKGQSWFWVMIIGNAWFLGNIIFAILYYKERIGAMDTSDYLVQMVSGEGIHFVPMRPAAVLTQVLPVLAIWSGLSLRTIMVAYSVNFVIVAYLIWWISAYIFRNKPGSVALLLFNIVGITHLFFWPVSENLLCINLAILLYCWLSSSHDKSKKTSFLLVALLSLLIFASHPLAIVVQTYVFVSYAILVPAFWKSRSVLFHLAGALFALTIFNLAGLAFGSKEQSVSEAGNVLASVKILSEIPGLGIAAKSFAETFFMVSLIGIVCWFWLLLTRRWLQAVLLISAAILYFIIFNLKYPNGESMIVRENHMLEFSLFAVLGTAELCSWLNKLKILPVILILICFFSGKRILSKSQEYSDRIAWHESMFTNLRNHDNRKYVMDKRNLPENIVPIGWALYSESLVLSSLHSPDSCFVLYAADDPPAIVAGAGNALNLYPRTDFWPYDRIETLNQNYFRLPESSFKLLNATFQTSDTGSVFPQIAIECVTRKLTIRRFDHPMLNLIIRNSSGKTFPSGPKAPLIACRILENGQEIDLQLSEYPLTIDIEEKTIQPIRIIRYRNQKGDYKMQFGLIFPGRQDLFSAKTEIDFVIE